MIEEISLYNLGVIAEAVLPLGPGFTAITGETGAGKTMVVQALGLLRGERAAADQVRSGNANAVVEGRWCIPSTGVVAERVHDAGGVLEPLDHFTDSATGQARKSELILSRSVSSEGRSRAVVGGRSVPVSVLGELGEQLVVVHGQSDQLRLRSNAAQREALDAFAGQPCQDLLLQYAHSYRLVHTLRAERDTLIAERAARMAEAETLRTALDDIAAVSPVAGEDDIVAEKVHRLTHLENLRVAAEHARSLLSVDASDASSGFSSDAISVLDAARKSLDKVAQHDGALSSIIEALTSASFLVSEVVGQLSHYLAELDSDEVAQLDALQQRRSDLAALVRKYGQNLNDVIEYSATAVPRLAELEHDSTRIEELAEQLEREQVALEELARELGNVRRSAAKRLTERVSAELKALAMPTARFQVQIDSRDELSASGGDLVQFLLSPHDGAEPKPLARGASGGELSRIMLALEVVLAETDPVPTFVFDEVDAGVGGASATEIGRRLAKLASRSQVIVVTHLAQVAAFATNHLYVLKGSDGSVTTSSVRQLHGSSRVAEIARLLSGMPDSSHGLAHAQELLERAAES